MLIRIREYGDSVEQTYSMGEWALVTSSSFAADHDGDWCRSASLDGRHHDGAALASSV